MTKNKIDVVGALNKAIAEVHLNKYQKLSILLNKNPEEKKELIALVADVREECYKDD